MVTIAALFALRYLIAGHGFMALAVRELDLLLLTAAIFLLAIVTIQREDNILSKLGRHYSLYIYIFHVLIMSVCEMVADHLPVLFRNLYMYINPLCVFLLSIALTYVLGKLNIIKV